MFGRGLILLLGLAAAVAIPFVTSKTSDVRHQATRWWLTGETEQPIDDAEIASSEAILGAKPPDTPPELRPEGPPIADLGEIFRFDATTSWVLGRWPRVTTRLAELDLQGYRVPLVSGTREDDLAGSLTYYFNNKQRVERITFRGTTGDARKLVALLATRHGFVRQTHNDPGLFLYQVKWNGKAWSELHVRPASVVSATSPYSRFEVVLNMRRPHWLDRPMPFRTPLGRPDPRPAPSFRGASAASSSDSKPFVSSVWRWLAERVGASGPLPAPADQPASVEPTAVEVPPGGVPSSPAATAEGTSAPQVAT